MNEEPSIDFGREC
jgi:hypothetical protein